MDHDGAARCVKNEPNFFPLFHRECNNTRKVTVMLGGQKNVIKMSMYVVFVHKKASALLSFLHEKKASRFCHLKCQGQREFGYF